MPTISVGTTEQTLVTASARRTTLFIQNIGTGYIDVGKKDADDMRIYATEGVQLLASEGDDVKSAYRVIAELASTSVRILESFTEPVRVRVDPRGRVRGTGRGGTQSRNGVEAPSGDPGAPPIGPPTAGGAFPI